MTTGDIVGGVVIYFMAWWISLFLTLPFGVKGRHEGTDDGVKGADPGAPVAPGLRKKMMWTSVIALGMLVVVEVVMRSGIIDLRQ